MVPSVCSRRPRSCGQHRRVAHQPYLSSTTVKGPASDAPRAHRTLRVAIQFRKRAGQAEQSLRARLAAYALHAQRDPRETTANGRAAFLARFDREVDPEGRLEPDERRRRAEQARRAYFARLSLAAIKARQAKRAAQARRKADGTAA
jgi:hypothetical protein